MSVGPRTRQPFTGLAIAAVLGIVAADYRQIELPVLLPVFATLAVVALLARRNWITLLFVTAAFFALHTIRHYHVPARSLDQLIGPGPVSVSGTGVVIEEPRVTTSDRGKVVSRFVLRLRRLEAGRDVAENPGDVSMVWRNGVPAYGDLLEFSGSASRLSVPRNPGEFDYAGLLRRRGIYSGVEVRYRNGARATGHGVGNPLIARALAARNWMQKKMALGLEDAPEVAGLVQSIVLGLKRETPEEVQHLFEKTGTLHLFVVNGLHVGLFSLLAFGLLRAVGCGRRAGVIVLIPLLWFYALVTGLNPGSIRATVMGSILLVGYVIERPALTFNNFAAAFFLTLLWSSEQLFMPGFQFSFGVVFSILLLAPPLQRWFSKTGVPDPFLPRALWGPWQFLRDAGARHVAGLLAVSFSAWIGSLFFTVRYFHLISPAAVIANLVMVPTAFLILGQGLLSILSAGLSDALAAIFNNANFAVVHLLLTTVNFFASLPGGCRYVELPRRGEKPLADVTVLDVGAGAAIHVRSGGSDWLIDCGNGWSYEDVVRPYLRMRGVNTLAGLLLTHGDAAHLGAGLLALDEFQPEMVGDSALRDRSLHRRAFHLHLAETGRGKAILSRGDSLVIRKGGLWRVLYPPSGLQTRAADDKALVLQFEAGGRKILFMSDSGFLTEQWLLSHETCVRSEVLVKGSHRDDFSGSFDFMSAVSPAVVVLSQTAAGDTGRLPDGWHEEMSKRGIEIFDQTKTGAVNVAVYPDGVTVGSWLGGHVFSNRTR